MSIKIREIYYHAVCFVTLIFCIFALTGMANIITDIFSLPQFIFPQKWKYLSVLAN